MSDNEVQGGLGEMKCEDVLDLLYRYACDELEPAETQAVETHLEGCEHCRKALGEHEVLKRVLPKGFVDRKLFYYSSDA